MSRSVFVLPLLLVCSLASPVPQDPAAAPAPAAPAEAAAPADAAAGKLDCQLNLKPTLHGLFLIFLAQHTLCSFKRVDN